MIQGRGCGHTGKGLRGEEPAVAMNPCLHLGKPVSWDAARIVCGAKSPATGAAHVRGPRGLGTPNQILKLWPTSQPPSGWHSRGP